MMRARAIRISGNIELTEVNIAFKTAGKLVERTVDEGAPVRKGMVIARLDQEQLRHQYERAQATLASAESRRVQTANRDSISIGERRWTDRSAKS